MRTDLARELQDFIRPLGVRAGQSWLPVVSNAEALLNRGTCALVAIEVGRSPVRTSPCELWKKLPGLHMLNTARLRVRVLKRVVDRVLTDYTWCARSSAVGFDPTQCVGSGSAGPRLDRWLN